jgi:hypothetical protein
MKTSSLKFTIMSVSVTLALTLLLASSSRATAGGTDILHLTSVTVMTNNNVEPNADGVVAVSQKEQGHANNQTLAIAVRSLTASNTYELVAIFDNDTNVVDVGPFTTDARGKADFKFTSLGRGHGGGKHSTALPDGLNPVSLVREVDIVDTNMQVILSADLSSPNKLQYLVKRNISTNDVKASLFTQASQKKTHFRLQATGLATNADYQLVLNDEVVQTNTANTKGRLDIHSLTDTPPYILDVRSVALWDSSSNVVLQTELP